MIKMENNLVTKLRNKISVQESTKYNPRILIKNVVHLDGSSDELLCEQY